MQVGASSASHSRGQIEQAYGGGGRGGLAGALLLTSSIPSQIEEVPGELMQEDLATDDVMLLDIWDQVGEARCCKSLSLSEPPFSHLQNGQMRGR